MSWIAFLLFVLCVVGTGLVYAAGQLTGTGLYWADRIYGAFPMLCDHSYWGVLTSAAVGALYLLAQAIEN